MPHARPIIVVAESYAADALERLGACGDLRLLRACDDKSLKAAVADADALLVRTYSRVTAEVIAAGPHLRVIGRGGVGIENIDRAAARQRGITVVYTPAASTRSVAEHTFALLLAVLRQIVTGDAATRSGRFAEFRAAARFRELGDCTLGIIGMGRIGSAVGRIAAAGFGMRVLYNDIVPVGPFDFPADPVEKAALYSAADVTSLHVPLTHGTRGLIAGETLARFPGHAILLNTSRGAVVDGQAVARALCAGRLGGAGLDVFEDEPLPDGHPLLTAPGAVLTPHVAGRSVGALDRMNAVVEDVIAVLEGRPPRYPAADEDA